MNKRQKEVIQYELDSEKAVIEELRKQYQRALNDIDRRIRILESDELTQSRVYRIEYQKALRKQVGAILEKLHSDEYATIQKFLSDAYITGYVGAAYDMFGQGVPLIMPIDRDAAVKAVMTDSKISEGLYEALGVDTKKLKTAISAEITRGLAAGLPHTDIARNIATASGAPFSRAKTIVRTEAHRIQEASAQDARRVAVSKGANVVKQWKAIMDGKVRHSHRQLDGQTVEIDEPFKLGSLEAMHPGDFGDPAEDCNCRCRATQRARIAMNADELQKLKDRAEFFGLDKADSFEEFKIKYVKAAENKQILLENSEKSGKIELGKTASVANALANVATGGKRNEEPLTEAQIEIATAAAMEQGYKGDVQYSEYSNTSFHGSAEGHGFHFLVIGTDAYPTEDNGGSANERISMKGCMAHEVIGHYEAWLKGTRQSDLTLEEVQASIRASKFGVGLSEEERKTLFADAVERLKKAKINLEDVLDILDIWER